MFGWTGPLNAWMRTGFHFLLWLKLLEWERREPLCGFVWFLAAVEPKLRWRVWRWSCRDEGEAAAVDTRSSDPADFRPLSPRPASFPLSLYPSRVALLLCLWCKGDEKATHEMITHLRKMYASCYLWSKVAFLTNLTHDGICVMWLCCFSACVLSRERLRVCWGEASYW